MINQPAIQVRVSAKSVHYAGNLVDGSYVLGLFGDALTFVSCADDHDEGLLKSYTNVQLLRPVRPGNFLAVWCSLQSRTNLTRTYSLEATLQGELQPTSSRASRAIAYQDRGKAVATAEATVAIPYEAAREGDNRA